MKKLDDEMIIGAEDDGNGEYIANKRRGGDIIARVVCLFAAFLIWLYVMSVDSPEHEEVFRSVGITLESASVLKNEYNMSVLSGTGNVADVTIRGKKSVLNKYSTDDIKAYVDLSQITETGRHTLNIKADLPEGMMLVDIAPSSIEVYVDNNTTKNIRVVAEATYLLENCELGELVPEFAEISVSGPAKKLEQIDHALVSFDLGTVSKSMVASGALKLVDAAGNLIEDPYLKPSQKDIKVTIPVYTYKEVPITAKYEYGYLNESNSNVTITPAKVKLKGDPEVLAGIDELQVFKINEKHATADEYKQETKISVPKGVILENGETTATINIKHKYTSVKDVVITDFQVINPRNLEYRMPSAYTVILRVPNGILSTVTAEYITATIDLSHYLPTSGVVTLPVSIVIDPVFEKKVYEIGEDYTISLEILG